MGVVLCLLAGTGDSSCSCFAWSDSSGSSQGAAGPWFAEKECLKVCYQI